MKYPGIQRQSGSVLMVSLVILLVLTLLGVSGMNTTVMQERMAGNVQESLSAFQAAEAGLRDGEKDVALNLYNGSASCSGGACEPAATGLDVWKNPALVDWEAGTNTVVYGARSNQDELENVARQPAYVIERLSVVERGMSIVEGTNYGTGSDSEWYRITAKGYGEFGQSEAMVQGVYRK